MTSLRPAALLAWLAIAPGCVGPAFRVPNVTDPPQLAPERRMFRPVAPPDAGVELGSPESAVPSLAPGGDSVPELIVPEDEPPPLEPFPTPVPAPIPDSVGPRLPFGPITPAVGVDLGVAAPSAGQAGSETVYRLLVHNRGDVALDDVTLSVEFDDALVFPGYEEKAADQRLGRLAAGERKELSLTLVASEAGRHCARFSVLVGDREAVWKSVCIEFVPRRYTLELHGPSERTIGSRAEFTVVLHNLTAEPLAGARVSMRAPATFAQRAASASFVREGDALVWDLGELKAGERVELQAEYECRHAAENACVTVSVSGEAIPGENRETCLRVSPVEGILDLQVSDTADPLSVDDETEFVATVHNRGLQPAQDVRLDAILPPNFELVSIEVRQDDRRIPLRQQTFGRRIEFDTLPALAADRSVSYHIRARALAAGPGEFRASLVQGISDEPVEAAEPVLVRPGLPRPE